MKYRITSLILAVVLLFAVCGITPAADESYTLGDVDHSGAINTTDALLTLRAAVHKITLTDLAQKAADVDASGQVNTTDALLILRYAIKAITVFPGALTEEERYEQMIQELCTDKSATPVSDAYEIASDGGMIYNPLSREADKTGTLHKYDTAEKTSGTLSLGTNSAMKLNYSLPKAATAYDMVPITYSLNYSGSSPAYVEAVAFDTDETRYKNCDLTIPGKVDLNFEYLGYIAGTSNIANRPTLSRNMQTDTQGKQYPEYNTSSLTCSGTVQQSNYLWFRYRYTNTGNTILDSDGAGTFCFEPILQKKQEDGSYTQYATTENLYQRITDYLYPGDSGEMDISFDAYNLPVGDYRIVINALVRDDTTAPYRWNGTIWGGYTYCSMNQTFSVSSSASVTTPAPIEKTTKATPDRNMWLHSYEEFMTSYDTWLKPKTESQLANTMYLQCAPWTTAVILKITYGSSSDVAFVRVPIQIESDSISVSLSDGNNYLVKEDGTRYPIITAQSMADMRGNTQKGPDAAGNIINDLLDMQEAGVNYVNTTAAFQYDNTLGKGINKNIDAYYFMADCLRVLGIKMEGIASYPYRSDSSLQHARWISRNLTIPATAPVGYASDLLAKALGIKSEWQFRRWGDNYAQIGGTIPLSLEDTRGWMRVDINSRLLLGDETKANFRSWLETRYGTIAKLNAAWGTAYPSFADINPEEGTTEDHDGLDYSANSSEFLEWGRAVNELDVYRTIERNNNYKTLLAQFGDNASQFSLNVRTEGANWLATVPYNSSLQRYRHVYYCQRRQGLIPEILKSGNSVSIHSDYTTLPYTPSEVSELTKSSVENGFVPAQLPQFDRMRDIAINPVYGYDYSTTYNLSGKATKGVFLNTTISLFTWFKATYEAGGIPGILWQDYLCDGFATMTQRREMQFFVKKINEALATPEGQKWATDFEQSKLSAYNQVVGNYTYPQEYVANLTEQYKQAR